jgi:tetratricopeptide (TPR) repeat protein
MNYGLDLVNDGRLEEGLEKYRQAVRAIEPHPAGNILPEVRERLITLFGVHLVRAGNYEELLKLMTSKVAKDSGPSASVCFLAAMALMQLKRFPEAIPHLRECIAKRDLPTLTPPCNEVRKAAPHHMLADCLGKADKPIEAENEFKKALEMEPDSPGTLHDYAYFLHQRNRSLDALKILHQAVDKGINDERIWSLGGFVSNSKPEYNEFAIDWTAEAIRYCPEHKAIIGFRAEALLKAGRLSEALPLFRASASGQPTELPIRAAVILCEMAAQEKLTSVPPDIEAKLSRELIAWYRRLLATSARDTVLAINRRIGDLKKVLPTAGAMLEAAVAEAEPEK